MIQYQHIESVHIVSSRIRSDPSRSQGSQSTHYSFLGVFFVLQALLFLSLCTSSHYNFMCWVNSLVAASCRVIGHYSNFNLWMDFPLFSSFLISLKSSFLSLQILVQKANSSVALHPLLYLVSSGLVGIGLSLVCRRGSEPLCLNSLSLLCLGGGLASRLLCPIVVSRCEKTVGSVLGLGQRCPVTCLQVLGGFIF